MTATNEASVAENLALGAFAHYDCKAGAVLTGGQLESFVIQAKCPADDLNSDVQLATESGWAEPDRQTGGIRLTELGASMLRKA